MPMLRRVRSRTGTTAGVDGEDRLSALPDDLIRLIVRRLDTRTALSTAVLARRWAHIPRDLPELDFRVSDVLPPEYDRTVAPS
uniref:F-box domain-containing protein n=1 Tax=Aegilops tauschii subsp. strangulata TaxID=200361 RepID=A0A453PYU3_AEGTS